MQGEKSALLSFAFEGKGAITQGPPDSQGEMLLKQGLLRRLVLCTDVTTPIA